MNSRVFLCTIWTNSSFVYHQYIICRYKSCVKGHSTEVRICQYSTMFEGEMNITEKYGFLSLLKFYDHCLIEIWVIMLQVWVEFISPNNCIILIIRYFYERFETISSNARHSLESYCFQTLDCWSYYNFLVYCFEIVNHSQLARLWYSNSRGKSLPSIILECIIHIFNETTE